MSELVPNTTPAERRRGCIKAENFVSNEKVVLNGGTPAGGPIINFGLTTDGTDDVITYPLVRQVKSISFFITLETTTEDIMQLSSSHSIEVVSGTLTATGVTSPTFLVDGVATATITTARSHVTITTATAFDADAIQIGQDDSFGQFKMEKLKMWNTVLTTQIALDFANNTTYNYSKSATIDLQMGFKQHDPTNVRALDVSGKGNHATFGDGSTVTTFPTKLVKQGYDFDGTDTLRSGAFPSLSGSLAAVFDADFDRDNDAIMGSVDGSSNRCYLFIGPGGELSAGIGDQSQTTIKDPDSRDIRKGIHTAIVTWNTVTVRLYLDGEEVYSGAQVGSVNVDTGIFVGALNNNGTQGSLLFGGIFSAQMYTIPLTPLQIVDYHINAIKSINQV